MFLNISSSMGSRLTMAERITEQAASVRHHRQRVRSEPSKRRILLTMNVIVLNILGWVRCCYYNWATISKSRLPSRENRSRRKLHASKEKGCEEEKETLTVCETILRRRPRKTRKFRKAS